MGSLLQAGLNVLCVTEIYQSDKGGVLTVIKLVVKVDWQERLYVLKSHLFPLVLVVITKQNPILPK